MPDQAGLTRAPAQRRLASIAAAACAAAALTPATARSEPLGRAAIARQTSRAWTDWKAEMRTNGWTGLKPRIANCYRLVGQRRSQADAAYCAALDHLTLLDAWEFPASLRPAFFTTDAVFARLDKAVAQTTPSADRELFESRLLATIQETIHQLGDKPAAESGRRKAAGK